MSLTSPDLACPRPRTAPGATLQRPQCNARASVGREGTPLAAFARQYADRNKREQDLSNPATPIVGRLTEPLTARRPPTSPRYPTTEPGQPATPDSHSLAQRSQAAVRCAEKARTTAGSGAA
jgi:hypothetical protein